LLGCIQTRAGRQAIHLSEVRQGTIEVDGEDTPCPPAEFKEQRNFPLTLMDLVDISARRKGTISRRVMDLIRRRQPVILLRAGAVDNRGAIFSG
jgi:hypothetical protein